MTAIAVDKTTVPLVKGLSSLEHVQSLLVSSRTTKKSKLSQKAHLSLLRELCVFVSMVGSAASVDKTMFALLVKDLSDSNISDKLLRTIMFLLVEVATQHRTKCPHWLHPLKDPLEDLRKFLAKEVSSAKVDSKQILLLRSLYAVERFTPPSSGPLIAVDDALLRTLAALKYPSSVKQKRSMSVLFMSGFSDKESPQQQLSFWSAVMSAVSRTGRGVPAASCWDNVVAPLKHRDYSPLIQHSLRVLLHMVMTSDEKDLQSRVAALLTQSFAVCDDSISGSYFICIMSALATRTIPASPGCLGMDELLSLFRIATHKFLSVNDNPSQPSSSSPKASAEMIIALVGRTYSAEIMTKLQFKTILPSIAASLVFHLRSVTVGSVELSPLLRATRALGKFLLRRY
jgi:hypothetical protein